MLKSVVSEVAKELGKSPAFLLNQLKTLMGHWGKTTIYRTNQELAKDLEGVCGIWAIKNAKKKLIEEGYVTVTFDGKLNRQTYYTLTPKALLALSEFKVKNEHIFPIVQPNGEVKEPITYPASKTSNTDNVDKPQSNDITVDGTTLPEIETKPKNTVNTGKNGKHTYKKPNYEFATPTPKQPTKTVEVKKSEETALASSSAMKKSFEEGFSNPNAVPAPKMSLRELSRLKAEQERKDIEAEMNQSDVPDFCLTQEDETFNIAEIAKKAKAELVNKGVMQSGGDLSPVKQESETDLDKMFAEEDAMFDMMNTDDGYYYKS